MIGSQQSGLLLLSRATFLKHEGNPLQLLDNSLSKRGGAPAYGSTCIEFYPAEKVGEFERGDQRKLWLGYLSHALRPPVDAQ